MFNIGVFKVAFAIKTTNIGISVNINLNRVMRTSHMSPLNDIVLIKGFILLACATLPLFLELDDVAFQSIPGCHLILHMPGLSHRLRDILSIARSLIH